MDGKENQGQDRRQDRRRRRGKIPTPVLQWVEAQRRMQDEGTEQQQPPPPPQPPPRHQQNQQYQQYQQNQQYQQYQQNQQNQQQQQQQQLHHQLLQQQQPDLSLQFDSFANDLANFENTGPDGARGYTTTTPGAARTGQPQRGLPIVFPPPERRYYGYNAIRPLVFPPSPYGPSPPPPPYASMNNGAGVPAMTSRGPPVFHRPIFETPAANHRAGQGAGAFGHPAQVAQAQGNRQPHNVAPRSVAPPNVARNAPARARQAGGEQPSRKRLADGKPRQPAAKKHAGGGATGKAPSEQPCTGHMQPTTSASDHHLTISERLDRGLITDVAGLTREEEDKVLLWARRQGMKWKDIHEKFKFQGALSTLRGRYRDLMHKGKPPKKAVFNELDEQLLLDAVPRIAGRRLDDVDDCNVKALWNKVKEYIRTNGGQTTAGSGTLKLKYIELTRGEAAAKAWKEAQKQKKGKTKGKAPNESDAKDSEAQEETPQWKHEEYARYPVQGMEGADFGDSVNEDEDGQDEEGDFESDEEDSQYDDEMEDDADFD